MPTLANSVSRRRFLGVAAGSLAAGSLATRCVTTGPTIASAAQAIAPTQATSETLAQILHASLSPIQKKAVCVPWNYVHPKFGLLRTRVGNNWNATEPDVAGSFFSKDQQRLVRDIFEHLIQPEWHARFDKQLEDDTADRSPYDTAVRWRLRRARRLRWADFLRPRCRWLQRRSKP